MWETAVLQRSGEDGVWHRAVDHQHANRRREMLRRGLHAGVGRPRPRDGERRDQVWREQGEEEGGGKEMRSEL